MIFLGNTIDFKNLAGSLKDNIASTYEDVGKRDDVEAFEKLNDSLAFPKDEMQVIGEYTMYVHFFFLRKLFDNTEKIRFFSIRTQPPDVGLVMAFRSRLLLANYWISSVSSVILWRLAGTKRLRYCGWDWQRVK